MESSVDGQANMASQPMGNGQTHSPQRIDTAAKEEFPIVARLTQGLAECDWDELQNKYTDAMDEHSRVEQELRDETARLLEAFTAWSQTTVLQDEHRALKRFKTQMLHVQNSEVSVENKKKHYNDVVKAFQSALALLNEQMKA